MELTVKQTKALDYLEDNITNDLLYGGAAGGGKSILGCYWIIKSCLKYPDTRWLIGRSELKTLKDTTLVSFFKVCEMQGLKAGAHYNFNQQSNTITFKNKSVIILKDLFQYPSDQNFDSLGSLEITGAFIDECNQITEKAKNIVRSRIRHNIDEYGLIAKMLMTCNPAKNWVYSEFYKPDRDGTLSANKKFIRALVTDNNKIASTYRQNLLGLDEASKQRLLYGNFEYDSDLSTLIQYDKILDCFTNTFLPYGESCITADIARFGADKTVIGLWQGWRVKMYTFKGKDVVEVAQIIKDLQTLHGVPNSRTIADEDGIGGGVVDILKCKGFVNNSMPLPEPNGPRDKEGNIIKPNYSNLKSQCYYRLAKRINDGGVFIEPVDVSVRELIIGELEQVKQHNMDKDGKKSVVPKDVVKELIGRSPDYSDTLMMREWFELVPKKTFADASY